jgi:ATP-dependent DNA helicase RecQ
MEDRTIDAQKLLSCIGRTQQRFGLKYVIDVLRGAKTQKIRDHHHDQLSTYGIGRDVSVDEWTRLGRALLQQGFLSEDNEGYHILKLNTNSREILRSQRTFSLASTPTKPADSYAGPTATKRSAPSLEPIAEELFLALRDLRKQLADERSVPPYVVFPDTSLRIMAQQFPQTRDAFLRIPGVGQQKLHAYYTPFTEAIRSFAAAHGLEVIEETDEPAQPSISLPAPKSTAATAKTSTRGMVLDLYRQGLSIADIALVCDRQPSTITAHLSSIIEDGELFGVEHLLQPGHYPVIVEVLLRLGGEQLKPIKEELGDEYSYDEIRLTRAYLRASRADSTDLPTDRVAPN